ncbi:MAG: hypothetical protein VX834_04240 [Myxococcota bacterium]|nr:hypothetical protein [Myxococcota bacterium]
MGQTIEGSWYTRGRRGFVGVRGDERVELLHRLSTRNLEPLKRPGHLEWTVFTTSQGKMVDWVAVYSLDDGLLLRVSEGRDTELADWLDRYIIMEDVEVEVVTSQWADLQVEGADALGALGLTERPVSRSWIELDGMLAAPALAAYPDRLELIVPADKVEALEGKLGTNGVTLLESEKVEEIRIQAGVPSPSFEYAKPVNPLELRMVESSISWNKGCYIGQEVISRLDSYDKVARMMMGIRSEPGAAIALGARVEIEGKRIGKMTSWLVEAGVGLAIVERDACKPGSCAVVGENGLHSAELVDCPFWS